MRIVEAVGWYFPEGVGGTEVYVAGLCRRLRHGGNTVLVAAPDPASGGEREYEHDGVRVYRYPIPAEPNRAECQERLPVRGAERLHAWLGAVKPDVIHFHTFVTGLGIHEVIAARRTGARVIVTSHAASLGYICQRGTLMRWGRSPCDGICRPVKCAACELQHRGLPRPAAWAVAALPSRVARRAASIPGKLGTALGMSDLIAYNQEKQRKLLDEVDALVLLTEASLRTAAENGAPREKLVLNRLGFGQSSLPKKPSPDLSPTRSPVRVGYLGRYEAIKGVRDLTRAVSELDPELPIKVEIRGPVRTPSERAYCEELRLHVRGDARVRFEPAVPKDEVGSALAGLDVLCCPSVCAEGGPTVAIEAHAVGTPVIGTRIGGLAELVTDRVNGRLVPPGDFRALARVLAEVAEDPAGTIDLWRRKLPVARSMDEVARDYVALYGGSR